jgi:hypothetical protein
MTDALFGSLGACSGATKTTTVYSTNYLDLGTISSKSRFTKHTLTPNLYAHWQPRTAMNAADSFVPLIYHADNSGFSSNNEFVFTGPATALGLAEGYIVRARVPETVREFLELALTPESTGVFTATVYNVWFEVGGQGSDLL